MRYIRAIAVVLLADLIVSDSGYAVPVEVARAWAQEIVGRVLGA